LGPKSAAKSRLIRCSKRPAAESRLSYDRQVDPIWLEPWSRDDGARRVRNLFAAAFGDDGAADSDEESHPIGVWSAPGRVNLIGEHTDYNGGLCLPIALPHRTYVAMRARDDTLVRLRSAQIKETWEADLADLQPGSVSGWGAYVAGVAWALREAGFSVGGFDAAVDSCVPFGASLSSSAALECAVAVALSDLFGLGLAETLPGREELVVACRRAENEIAGAPTGGLDQSASLLCRAGAALLLDFDPMAEEFATLVPFDLSEAGLTILVIDSRAPHQLVDGQYAERRDACEEACRVLNLQTLRELPADQFDAVTKELYEADPSGVLAKRVRHVVGEIERTRDFARIVADGLGANGVVDQAQAEAAGALMNASHDSLRDDYQVTVPETDLAVDTCRAAGAYGARMTGGGFGGSTIALITAGDEDRVANAVTEAFAKAGFAPPAFLPSPPSPSAGRDRDPS